MAKGSENGYTYTGDDSSYRVTMLKRDTKRRISRSNSVYPGRVSSRLVWPSQFPYAASP